MNTSDNTSSHDNPEAQAQQSIQIIADDEGMLVLGNEADVDSWLASQHLGNQSRKLKKDFLEKGSAGLQALGELAEQNGRWVKLTKESAKQVAQYGDTGTGVVRQSGKIKSILKFENLSHASSLLSPQMLTGAAGIMSQMALQQSIDEINDYLEIIDMKLDDLLQDQKDQSIANLAGVAHMIDETMSIRDKVGSITATTWSKVAGCSQDLARAQAYSLLKIQNLAQKLSETHDATRAQTLAEQLRHDFNEWASILANAIQLQDKMYVIELDRVTEERPETVMQHRTGINEARHERLLGIEKKLNQLNTSMQQAAQVIRAQKVMHPFAVTQTLEALEATNGLLAQFATSVGIAAERSSIEMAPRWKDAASTLITDSKQQIESGSRQFGQGVARLGGEATQALGHGAQQLGQHANQTMSLGAQHLREKLSREADDDTKDGTTNAMNKAASTAAHKLSGMFAKRKLSDQDSNKNSKR
ncbi:hypothetical protein [Bifidobacterium sp.]|uniref:hypothetical protein n=1 Tax=Bifidobacterium sp. TaxID=41200 RepID=UPI0039E92BC2